jgi:hypothetical protein
MNDTLAWVIGAVVVALVIFAIVMGKRLASGRIRFGKHIEGEVRGNVAPPVADENVLRGKQNQIGAAGDGASASRNQVNGDGNIITARTSPAKPK